MHICQCFEVVQVVLYFGGCPPAGKNPEAGGHDIWEAEMLMGFISRKFGPQSLIPRPLPNSTLAGPSLSTLHAADDLDGMNIGVCRRFPHRVSRTIGSFLVSFFSFD